MPTSELRPRLRFAGVEGLVFGPGKAELLRHILTTGSIVQAAARMKMSYNRAWTLVRDMNALFREPLVTRTRGGAAGGGTVLTKSGQEVLRRYTRMEAASLRATRRDWEALRAALRS
jgi:molybdate transport system regulatory protein